VLNDLYTSFTTFWTYPNVRTDRQRWASEMGPSASSDIAKDGRARARAGLTPTHTLQIARPAVDVEELPVGA
jgi:hypothetical protein